jgi:signal transduction histidine kinase
MANSFELPALKSSPKGLSLPLAALRRRLRTIQWLAPVGMALVVILYELGPASWIQRIFGSQHHFLAEILFFGSVGPVLVFLLMDLLGRWLEEREINDVQAQVLAQALEHARISHEVTDDALQAIFAASVILSSLENRLPDLPAEVSTQLRETNQALDPILKQLYAHQAKRPASDRQKLQ